VYPYNELFHFKERKPNIMILCVTPNTALDRTVVVPNFKVGEVYRTEQVSVFAGGKGLNVARALKILGNDALCAGFIGGQSGRFLAELAVEEGLQATWTSIAGSTRTCISIADPNNGETTVINEQGPSVTVQDWLNLQHDVLKVSQNANFVSINGSLPPDTLTESFVEFIHALQNQGHSVWVDTNGAPLKTAVTAAPKGLKINHLEAATIIEKAIDTPQMAADAAQTLLQTGIEMVIITMGKKGAVLAAQRETYYAISPYTQAISTVGSGDVFFAGLMNALSKNESNAESLRQATAAGAANTLTLGAGLLEIHNFERILEQTIVE
jgi:1-phosphofructokinase family hexose kinase